MRQFIALLILSTPLIAADADKSAQAVSDLKAAIEAKPKSIAELADKPFASVPLTKADAATSRELLWKLHTEIIKAERAEELKAKVLKEDKLEMPFFYKTFGDKKPKNGWSLWISLHGGGGAPARVNDQQYENQKKLYQPEEGIYLAPRAPTNTWNLWHEGHIDRLFTRLIEDLIVLEGVDPNRVYVMGYSAGGDGVYQLAPRMADRWAAAAMMAGHPNGVSLLSLRNVPFALQVGGDDAAFDRNRVGKEYGRTLDKLRNDDPDGYEHLVRIHPGKPHWMGLQDKLALPWMATFTRNPIPDKVVWKQTGTPHERSYWLAVSPNEAKNDSLVVAKRDKYGVDITTAEKVGKLLVRFDDRMVDLDQPIFLNVLGEKRYVELHRTVAVLAKTLSGRGDPGLIFSAEIELKLGK